MAAVIRIFTQLLFISILSTAFVTSASAGPFTDSLSRCLVVSVDTRDKTDLMNWMARLITEHPEIKNSVGEVYSDIEAVKSDVAVARLFEKLLTVNCRQEAIEAVRYEENIALEESFKVLGQIAMRDLMADPSVSAVMEQFTKYIDESRFVEIFE